MSDAGSSDWGLFAEDGSEALAGASLLSIEIKSGGKVLTEPVEIGGFAAYNKVEEPIEINLTVGRMGDAAELTAAGDRLEELRRGTEKLTLSTPRGAWPSMNLENFGFKMAPDGGAYVMIADCKLVEIREVESNVTTESGIPPESCKNASSSSGSGGGGTKAGTSETAAADKPRRQSALHKGTGTIVAEK